MPEQVTLRISQKIQVAKKDSKDLFNSSIQDIKNGVISIAMPYLKERPMVLRRNDEVTVRFTLDESSYMFETRVLGEARDNIILYRLAYPAEINRVQQRMHVRLQVMMDIQYAVLERDNKAMTYKKATTVDISGGGMKIAVRKRIKENTLIKVIFTLPLRSRPERMELAARVVRSQKVDPGKELYHLGIKFENINFGQEDKIVRFIFEKMAQQKRLL
ncbi:PilZ domain-containing protein [Desulfallas sp. Bu1-1]|uniref:flagellar brake protein n=1 Tax=Desulfallas sp. Bu1-1 TaxID=2787620 RepID=UPI00189E2D7C|nr:PilZ domain-containing protein [Desulfallas sp. Bu1-1]MBF7081945.1 PilZ domain-containing protein [Desulfallas sp. Bu1-1]